ncbi:MAG: DUF4339 domain-containing protein, partial [Halobacteriovoraceae bacterium]|nr:DUF4339 domain-containing protein [Halobacteriovoraceae bacterium]
MNKDWFIFCEDCHLGPFSERQIRDLYLDGKINDEVMLWAQGEKDWRSLREINSFDNLFIYKADKSISGGKISSNVLKKELEILFINNRRDEKKNNLDLKSRPKIKRKIIYKRKRKSISNIPFPLKTIFISVNVVILFVFLFDHYQEKKKFDQLPTLF